MYTYSKEHIDFLKQIKRRKRLITFTRLSVLFFIMISWECLSNFNIINHFLFSCPSHIIHTMIQLLFNGELLKHLMVTLYEVFISFFLGMLISFLLATIMWSNDFISKVIDPYITILNSLPKVALGPLIIIWVGASIHSIIFMALLISVFVTLLTIYQGFISVNANYVIMLKSFGANKWKVFMKIILPSSIESIISSLKINISMCLIGVIMGELLVSKMGLGYLIMYGSQVFQIDLVITSVFILGLISYGMYYLLHILERIVIKN